MSPILKDRYIVVVDQTRHIPDRLRGRMVAVLVGDGVVVKWLAQESKKSRIVLNSQNPEYEDIGIRARNKPIIGRRCCLLGCVRKSVNAGRV